MTHAGPDPLDVIGPALSTLRRRTRTPGTQSVVRNVVLNLLTESPGLTVGELAAEMDVAQPVASRAVAAAVQAGLVRRTASQTDGRRSTLQVTARGRRAWSTFAREQRRVFEEITADWSATDRLTFARLLVRYAADSSAWAGTRSRSARTDRPS